MIKHDPNVDNNRVAVELAETERYQNTILGTYNHRNSMPMIAFDSQGMTYY